MTPKAKEPPPRSFPALKGNSHSLVGWLANTLPGTLFRHTKDPERIKADLTEGIEEMTGYPPADFQDTRSLLSIAAPTDRAMLRHVISKLSPQNPFYIVTYRIFDQQGDLFWVHEKGRLVQEGTQTWVEGCILQANAFQQPQWQDTQQQKSLQQQQRSLLILATAPPVVEGDIKRVSQLATKLVAEATQVERVSVWLLNKEKTQLEMVDLYRRSANQHEAGSILKAEDFPAYFEALRSGRYIDAHDALRDPRTNEFSDIYLRPLGITSMIDAALRVGGEVVGALCLEHVGPQRMWQDHEISFSGEVSDQIAHALLNRANLEAKAEQVRLQEQLFRSQKIEAVGRLAGGIAHDFHNLLTVIAGHAEILSNLKSPQDREHALQIVKTTEQATELTRQLLTFSRNEQFALTEVDLVATVRGLEKMLRRLIQQDIGLSVELPEHPLTIHATQGFLQQILTNLVVNARDAISSPNGYIAIQVEEQFIRDPKTLGVSDLAPGSYAVLHVKDSGQGMSKDVIERIFEPFFTTKSPGEGTGLGLSTVYGIVRRCRGHIAVKSAVGAGTRFSVYLPLQEATETSPEPSKPQAYLDQFGQDRLLLIAEDNPDLLKLTEHFLQRAGFRIITANNTIEALSVLQQAMESDDPRQVPDLVLSDMIMPQGGGLALLAWLRKRAPSIPIAFMSGYMDEQTAQNTEDIPCLQKPFYSKELYQFLHKVLEAK